jgi:diaminopimelate epimerase
MIRDVPFAKFHGLGNDWLVVDGKDLPRSLSKFARAILHRRTGIGADGLLLMMPPRDKKHAARLRFFNPDGSEAEMSGNGIRCAAAFLAELSPARRTFLIETPAGLKSLEKVSEEKGKWLFRVGMGAPVLEPAKIPFKVGHYPAPINGYPLRTQQGLLPVTVTSLGNPHCSIFVADFASLDWANLGREIETNPLFPKRTNVEFVKVISRKEIAVRFWERGVGHTMSSGTGSCAATVASILNGLTARQVRVRTEAGLLQVAWPENGEILLTGPVERVGQGTYTYGCTGPPRPGFSPRLGKGGVKQATAPPKLSFRAQRGISLCAELDRNSG